MENMASQTRSSADWPRLAEAGGRPALSLAPAGGCRVVVEPNGDAVCHLAAHGSLPPQPSPVTLHGSTRGAPVK